MTTMTTWPAHTTEPIPVPLPRLGQCADCCDDIRIRDNDRLYAHGCAGDGSLPLIVLPPTFARWLRMQSKRRDEYSNLATLVAARHFRGCTRTRRTAADVDWETAEELHGRMHLMQLARAGSDLMRPESGQRCDGSCSDLEKIAAVYRRLVEDAGGEAAVLSREPVVRACRRDAGWVLPDYTDLADCTTNFFREQDGRPACTATAVWKVVEEHVSADGFPMLTIGFYCDADLPDEHKPDRAAA